MMTFEKWLLKETYNLKEEQLKQNLELLDQGIPIPYLAQFCKDQTGNMSEETLFELSRNKQRWGELIKKQKAVLKDIKSQNKLTDELKSKIENTFEFDQLDNLHIPYKKKRPKPQLAKDAGLEPLAFWIWQYCHGELNPLPKINLHQQAENFLNIKANIKSAEDAINGAKEILIEKISEDLELRELCRKEVHSKGHLRCKTGKEADPKSKYAKFHNFHEKLDKLYHPKNSSKYLQIRRAWAAKEITNSIGPIDGQKNYELDLQKKFEDYAAPQHADSDPGKILYACAQQSLKAWVLPDIETEIHRDLKTRADKNIIKEASENLKKALLQSAFGMKKVLGLDPYSQSASVIALVDEFAQYKESFTFDLSDDENKKTSFEKLKTIIENEKVEAIVIGNDASGRDIETLLRQELRESKILISTLSQDFSNLYANSKSASKEFPELDNSIKRAVSLARRFQDPLVELVKLDPKLLSPVQFSSDVLINPLRKALGQVISSMTSRVGLDLNYANSYALRYLPGLDKESAEAIVEYRTKNGFFKSLMDLLKVEGMDQKKFKYSSAFLQVSISDNPLDQTRIQAEHYELLKDIAIKQKIKLKELFEKGPSLLKNNEELQNKLGPLAFQDLLSELAKEHKSPRKPFRTFKFRPDIKTLTDLSKDMICPGIVTNVTEFGAFVDIGVGCDGLVHSSVMAKTFVKNPKAYLAPGDRVSVKILEVDLEKKQIALTMKFEMKKPPKKKPFKKGPKKPKQKESSQLTHNPFAALAERFKAS